MPLRGRPPHQDRLQTPANPDAASVQHRTCIGDRARTGLGAAVEAECAVGCAQDDVVAWSGHDELSYGGKRSPVRASGQSSGTALVSFGSRAASKVRWPALLSLLPGEGDAE